MNEDFEILKLRKSIKSRFYLSAETIYLMVKELDSKGYQKYALDDMPFEINSPMEDAIRYKFIVLIELFKRFAKAISYTYFRYGHNTTSKEKYHKMNMHLLKDEDQVEEIEEILDDRNDLAHVFVDEILDFTDNNFFEKAKKSVILYDALEKYVEFVDEHPPTNRMRKTYLD